MIRAVIDTNILLQGITKKGLAGQIIDAWVGRRFLPCI
jgi:predicted nucleic acid-binding protein